MQKMMRRESTREKVQAGKKEGTNVSVTFNTNTGEHIQKNICENPHKKSLKCPLESQIICLLFNPLGLVIVCLN